MRLFIGDFVREYNFNQTNSIIYRIQHRQLKKQMEKSSTSLRREDILFLSENFPGHYYEITSKLGEGGIGVIYAVLLRELKT